MVKTRFRIEGVVVLMIGLVGLVEGLRLVNKVDPDAISDVLGPGYYILFLGLVLAAAGMVHFLRIPGRRFDAKSESSRPEGDVQKTTRVVFYMIATLLVYIVLIYLFGYPGPTFLFFLIEFRLAGVKSWKMNILATTLVTVAFYLIFVQYCRMVFPEGFFFTWGSGWT